MWKIIKSEFAYHRMLFFGIFSMILIIFFNGVNPFLEGLSFYFFSFLLIFIMLSNWNSRRNTEKRDRLLVTLPVASVKIALARILVMLIATLAFLLIVYFLQIAFLSNSPDNLPKAMKTGAILICIFTVYYILRESFLHMVRNWGLTRDRNARIVILVILALNIMGLVAFLGVSSLPQFFDAFRTVEKWVIHSQPFAGEYGILKFVLLGLVFNCENLTWSEISELSEASCLV
jgi:hypothetical protein